MGFGVHVFHEPIPENRIPPSCGKDRQNVTTRLETNRSTYTFLAYTVRNKATDFASGDLPIQ